MHINKERFLSLLEEQNMTQKDLAARIHIAPSTLNGYIHVPNRRIEPDVLNAIAKELHVCAAYLCGASDSPSLNAVPENEQERSLLDTYRQLNENNQKKVEKIFHSLLNQQS